ncbi:MAG: GNAT family N-acetyltransferase [Candidatus Eremiobacteraeota bacterium]|nr:GNAT family N-acetyltransferase [Candidatus Eremiobacteraeota bacterium]
MTVELSLATSADLDWLTASMEAFYREVDSHFEPESARRALAELLANPAAGRLWLVQAGEPVGYLALTFGFSLELGGRDAFIDDLYIRPEARSQGIGTRALELAIEEADQLGLRALHLEVDHTNQRARQLYARLGFRERNRYFLMCRRPD